MRWRRWLGPSEVALLLFLLLAACARGPERPPNVVLIVVDTLRFDHLTFYGYERATSPEIERRLAARGMVLEDAYAQAPWTLPSVASLLTGLQPAALLDDKGDPWGVPEALDTLAERLRARGYQTAAFVANPTVHDGNGFAQGFDHFHVAPYDLSSLDLHAGHLNEHVLAWLETGPREPFFLYLHYLDPHDPYANPDVVDGRSPFYPEYRGALRGDDVHGLYLGRVKLEDPVADRAQLAALYDSEIRWVDRHVGRVLDTLPEAVARDTLFVFTSDHGEELGDHGGWKHGETLYEEQIHVPLVLRWDGRIPAGTRLPGTVRLLDLLPTILAATGDEDPRLPGIDLLPTLRGERPLPRRPAFAQHLAGGPARAMVTLGGRKIVLFDRHAPFTPADERAAILWRKDVERMTRLEAYDLDVDPGERRNLAAGRGVPFAEPAPGWLARELDRWRDGLRVVAGGLEPGSTLELELRLDRPAVVRSLFLGPDDRLEVDGTRVVLRLRGDTIEKGLLIHGDATRVEHLRATLDGRSLAPAVPPTADPDAPWDLAELRVERYPSPPMGPSLRLWVRPTEGVSHDAVRDEETLRRLRALGYVGD